MATNRRKPKIVVVFDGVIYDYDKYGWIDIDELKGLPLKNAVESMKELEKVYDIVIYSDRCSEPRGKKAVANYLDKHQIPYVEITNNPPPYFLFIGAKHKEFPRRWKEGYVEELKSIAPRGG